MVDSKPRRRFFFPPAIPLAGLLIAWVLERMDPGVTVPVALRVVGIVVGLLAAAVGTWALLTFHAHRTTFHARGDTRTFVTAGPFRFSRNPMYVSLVAAYIAFALVFSLPWAVALLVPVYLGLRYLVVAPEELYLEGEFGDAYTAYRHRVRRWL